MTDKSNHVCPKRVIPTDREVRRMVARHLLETSYARGLDTVAAELGCNEKTVRRGRDEETTIHPTTLIALFRTNRAFRETLLADVGERPVPINAKCDTDALSTTTGAVHKLAVVTSESSPGGKAILDEECLDIEPDIDDAIATLSNIKQRCHLIRKNRERDAS